MVQTLGFLLMLASSVLWGPPGDALQPDKEKAIREAAAKYAEAYGKGDIDALVAQFAPDATYDVGEGPVIVGRDAIRKTLAANLAAAQGTKMTIDVKSIRFIKGRAIELGEATFTPAKGEASTVAYRAIHTEQPDGKWLITGVGPDVTAVGSSSAGPLDELAWMLGVWKDDEADVDLECTCRWDANRRFLIRTFVMKDAGSPSLEVTEIIGWDAANRIVRSWVFDSDGGTVQNTWSKRGDEWIILAKGTLPDGGRAAAVNIIRYLDDNAFQWSSTNRDVDGEMLPDINNIKMVRAIDTPSADGGK